MELELLYVNKTGQVRVGVAGPKVSYKIAKEKKTTRVTEEYNL